jgi:hypothetical protein
MSDEGLGRVLRKGSINARNQVYNERVTGWVMSVWEEMGLGGGEETPATTHELPARIYGINETAVECAIADEGGRGRVFK